jgi:hypothetical protein
MNSDLLCVLAEIHEWEIEHHVVFKTVLGRALYFGILHAHLNGHRLDHTSLKQLVNPDVATDRGVRLRMREFEKIGLIYVELNTIDKRTKRIVPTEKLIELMNAHASQFMRLFQKRFIVIKKDECGSRLRS